MYMFLTILLAGVPVMILSCLLFAAAARRDEKSPPAAARPLWPASEPRFFAGETDAGAPAASIASIEAVLSELERHIRLEKAAAESFLDAPTVDSLRSRTTSSFMN